MENEQPQEQLTDRQQQALDYIAQSIEARGYPPTLREIGEHMGIRSTNGVNDHLKALEKKGYLLREDLKSRALRPVGGKARVVDTSDDYVNVPMLGRVAAGEPILAVEQADTSMKIDRSLLGVGGEIFSLKIKGDSMIEAGIFDGDFIFVKRQPTANRGDIVVAMINDEATCKYYHPEGEQISFKPANSRLQPIVVRRRDMKSVQLLGVVVGMYRKV